MDRALLTTGGYFYTRYMQLTYSSYLHLLYLQNKNTNYILSQKWKALTDITVRMWQGKCEGSQPYCNEQVDKPQHHPLPNHIAPIMVYHSPHQHMIQNIKILTLNLFDIKPLMWNEYIYVCILFTFFISKIGKGSFLR